MLKITNDGRKLALDQRLINELLPENKNSKVNACIKNILKIYHETVEEKVHSLSFVICLLLVMMHSMSTMKLKINY